MDSDFSEYSSLMIRAYLMRISSCITGYCNYTSRYTEKECLCKVLNNSINENWCTLG